MSEITGLDATGMKQPLGRLSSKTQVSIEVPQSTENISASDPTRELKTIEFEMEQADHAFALMMEIRQKIEKQYQELLPHEPE